MDDVVFVGLFLLMMGAAAAYVRLCARIVGDAERPVVGDRAR